MEHVLRRVAAAAKTGAALAGINADAAAAAWTGAAGKFSATEVIAEVAIPLVWSVVVCGVVAGAVGVGGYFSCTTAAAGVGWRYGWGTWFAAGRVSSVYSLVACDSLEDGVAF